MERESKLCLKSFPSKFVEFFKIPNPKENISSKSQNKKMVTVIEFKPSEVENGICTKWYALDLSSGKRIYFTTPPLHIEKVNENLLLNYFSIHCFEILGN